MMVGGNSVLELFYFINSIKPLKTSVRVLLSIFRSRLSLSYNIYNFSDCRVKFFNIQKRGGKSPPGSSRMSSPRRRGSPFVFRAPPLRALRRRTRNARACKCNMLFTKKRGTSSPKMDLGPSTSPMEII